MQATLKNDNAENTSARVKLIVSRVIAYTFLILLTILCLFFFYLLFVNATMENGDLQAGKISVIPSTYFFKNLDSLFNTTTINIWQGLLNSILVATLSSVLTCYFSALTAYGIYAYDFKLKKAAEVFILAVMMIPTQLSSVGFYQMAVTLDLQDRLWVLIIPAIAAPATFFYMIQYLRATLPKDLIEASRMDGSNEFMTFNRIVLPIMKPALAVQMIFSFVGSWNNLYMPSLLLIDKDKKTLPIILSELNKTSWGDKDLGRDYVAIFLAIIPVIFVYLFLSKAIIKGVTAGSVKG